METFYESASLWPNAFFFYLIGPAFLAVGIFVARKVSKGNVYQEGYTKRGAITLVAFGTVASIFTVIVYISTLLFCVLPYRQGNYKIVEGYVENLQTTVCSNGSDKFSVNDVSFVVGYQISPGLNQKAECGGPISMNGEYVRISYVSIGDTNCIFKVEKRTG